MKLCAFDVETHGAQADFIGGSWASDQGAGYSNDREVWLGRLREHALAGYTLVAHNAEYDIARGLWPAGEDVTVHYFEQRFTLAFWRWAKRKKAARIIDSLNLAAGLSLAALGEELGLPKLGRPQVLTAEYQAKAWAWENRPGQAPAGWRPPPPDRHAWTCEEHGRGECIECYATRDARICLAYTEALMSMLETYGIKPSSTIAGNALKLWEYFDPNRQVGIRSDHVRRLARASFHGGRCEVFQYGTFHGVYTFDVRSHYLAIMRELEVPDPRRLFYVARAGREVRLDGLEGVIEAEVEAPYMHVPVLPAVSGGRIYYPVGRFRGSWVISELRTALQRGYRLLDVGEMAWTEHTMRPFGTFAEGVLAMREELRGRRSAQELVWKTLGNALAGRLGTSEGGEKRVYQRRVAGMDRRQLLGSELNFAGDQVYLSRSHRVPTAPRGANVLWASCITAAGRLRLLEELERAGDKLLYCDTDSVFSTGPLPIHEDVPGQLRDIGLWDTGVFLAPKMYRLEARDGTSVTRVAGVPRRVADDYFTDGKVIYEQSLGVVEAIARGIEPGRWEPVERARTLVPARRHPTNPAALTDRDQTSETEPPVFSGEGPWLAESSAERTAK